MPEATRKVQPVCVNCGLLLVRRLGHWVHDDTRAQYCAGDTDSEGAQINVRKAEPKEEIR